MTAAAQPAINPDEHLGLVHAESTRMAKRRAAFGDRRTVDDFLSDGYLGLLDACQRFEPARGWAFATLAIPRIRGAILDGMRREQEGPRNWRPSIHSLEEIRARQAQYSDEVVPDRTEREIADALTDTHPTPLMQVEQADAVAALRTTVVRTLTPKERDIVIACYWRGVPQREIARRLGITDSRVSQVLKGAYKKLHKALTLDH